MGRSGNRACGDPCGDILVWLNREGPHPVTLAELPDLLRNAVRDKKGMRLLGLVQLARQKSPVLERLVRPDQGGLALDLDFHHAAFSASQIDNDIHTIPCHEAVLDPSFTRAQLQSVGIVPR